MIRNLLSALAFFLTLIPLAEAQGNTRYYDVELIIFERNDTAAARTEFWPAVTQRPGTGMPLFNDDPSVDTSGFMPLGGGKQQFGGAYIALARSPAYTPIVHMAWRQPGLDAAHAVPVRIEAGQTFAAPNQTAASAVLPNDLGQNLALDSTTPIVQASGLRQVEGTVKVVLGRYLHVYTDLILRRPMPESFAGENRVPGIQATTDGVGVGFRNLATTLHEFPMKQHRRMRSNEAHYLDHPMMGIIIIVRRAPGGA